MALWQRDGATSRRRATILTLPAPWPRGWILDGGDWYYADASGAVHSGWLSANGSLYYLDPACGLKLATGYFSVDGSNYFASDSGEIAVRQWVTAEDGTTVFAGVDGALCGKLDGGVLYVPNADGCA